MMHCVVVFLAVTLVGASAGGVGGDVGGTKTDAGAAGGNNKPVGVGAYAYQDTSGNRYGGTYDINEEDLPNFIFGPNFSGYPGSEFTGNYANAFPFTGNDFLQELFGKLQFPLADGFHSGGGGNTHYNQPNMNPQDIHNLGQQYAQAGMQYAQQFAPTNGFASSGSGGYGYTSNQGTGGGNVPPFGGMDIGNFQHPPNGNSAYAAGSLGPEGVRQVASISPPDPNHPNIDISSRSGGGGNPDGFYSVSSSSYASSSDSNGRKQESRGAKTIVNDNGNVKEYEVHN